MPSFRAPRRPVRQVRHFTKVFTKIEFESRQTQENKVFFSKNGTIESKSKQNQEIIGAISSKARATFRFILII